MAGRLRYRRVGVSAYRRTRRCRRSVPLCFFHEIDAKRDASPTRQPAIEQLRKLAAGTLTYRDRRPLSSFGSLADHSTILICARCRSSDRRPCFGSRSINVMASELVCFSFLRRSERTLTISRSSNAAPELDPQRQSEKSPAGARRTTSGHGPIGFRRLVGIGFFVALRSGA
jgi:hypothetical protein